MHYTITATNTGQTAYTGASFTDPLAGVLDDAAYNGDAAATAGSVSFASPDLTWTGDLAVGAAATITFSVTVSNPDTGDKSMASTVTSATAGNNCPASGGTDTACTTTVTVVNATTLTFTATADTAAAAAGGVVHYTITVANSGLTPYTGATFTAGLGGVLDDASYDNDAAATAGTVTFTSPRPDLDRRRARRRDGHHHLFGHREQPRHRQPRSWPAPSPPPRPAATAAPAPPTRAAPPR